ncbi:MAG TPA: MFS transporter [Flavitalea sp.]|nr:MFS transporter [Flavitalea sp.]
MNQSPVVSRTPILLVIITFLAFISLGLPDGLLGIAWPSISSRARVTIDSLGILLIAFTLGYLATSSASGKLIKLMPLGILLTISCFLTAMSLLTFALSSQWHILIIASFFLGSGGGAIDASINTFAASHFNASTVNWLHASYGIGATIGPLLVTIMLANEYQWFQSYLIVVGVQLSLALLFLSTRKNWKASSKDEDQHSTSEYFETLKIPAVWISMLIFFLYTGLEQGFGQWLYTILTKTRGISQNTAGIWVSCYWGSLTVGRIFFAILLNTIPVKNAVPAALIGIVIGASCFATDYNNTITLLGILVLGFSNAPIFPSLIAMTPDRVGKEHAATAIGVQISMAMLGTALIPGAAGLLSVQFGLQVIATVFVISALTLLAVYQLSAKQKS